MTDFTDAGSDRRSTEGAYLLSVLDDPFNTFPLGSVARDLARLVDDSENRRAGRSDWWGVSTAFQSVEDEHVIASSALLIGAAFVLAQGTIEESISLVNKLGELDPTASWFPRSKRAIMDFEARVHGLTGIAEIALINAVANYTKHHYEWPTDWINPSGSQRSTVDAVVKLGFRPGGTESNLDLALRELGAAPYDLVFIADLVIEWRRRVARSIRQTWGIHPQDC